MNDEAAFLACIEADPLDAGPRGVYADWLDERDRPDEAERQRRWVAAYHRIKEFTVELDDGQERDDEGRRVGNPKYDYGKVMENVEWWRQCITGEFKEYGLAGTISFSTNYASDTLEDPVIRREFWEAFAVLTGVQAPEALRNQRRYRCAC